MKINLLIDNFIKKILNIENEFSNLETKVKLINNLLDNLIDFCIKKNIYFFIENNIGYTQIINTFKFNLLKFIQKLVDPSNNLIDNYIKELENLEKFSDINSLLFKKFKSNKDFVKEEKNHVSFNSNIDIITYEDNDGFKFNDDESYSKLFPSKYDNIKLNNNNPNNSSKDNDDIENFNYEENNKLGLYIRILLSQNNNIIEFVEKINLMCIVLSDPTKKYNLKNPYDN